MKVCACVCVYIYVWRKSRLASAAFDLACNEQKKKEKKVRDNTKHILAHPRTHQSNTCLCTLRYKMDPPFWVQMQDQKVTVGNTFRCVEKKYKKSFL